ncbi:carbohydrate-binding protein [Mucilaginibacter sp. SP1R1]|uniref:carbohydrate-binding protein n=1 Tax=Mucilaginibacter sp. SP1R1 TaxID=2723091 RepID=UPI00160F219D|nr:carbohydrate-binding protein [Mucilaginibacter sp. SP1R1]MBB6151475.1 hypothetical protein [Mucilaginibacter sp. SP1R1]
MKKILFSIICIACISCAVKHAVSNAGNPWQNKIQQIPGKVECEYYNTGGEGIAYHESDSINNGSGKLNPADGTFLNEFRLKEGVDISYTKAHDSIDNNPHNVIPPKMNQLYVGWTVPGEWIKYTVKVNKSRNYQIGVMYTSNGDGSIALDLDDKPLAKDLKIKSTHDDRDPVQWRQWHHWNRNDSLATVNLTKGIHVLTIHIVSNGNMNLDYLEFR